MRWKNLPAALRFVISSVIILAFLAALFFAGIAIYGLVIGVDFATAWGNFLAVCRK